ncbi:MAG TPA: ester cyclase [Candidatus Limnocylindria bacterium]|nr:ester cyclase [Candidatus Limnocylindria bacterium]
MSAHADLVRSYWDVCWNERRIDRLGEIFHERYLHGRTESSPAQLGGIVQWAVGVFPDFRVEVTALEELGDAVATRSFFSGTHTGPIYGLRGTLRPIRIPTLDVFFFRDGKVWQYWHLTDHLPILGAIGAEIRVGSEVADLEG